EIPKLIYRLLNIADHPSLPQLTYCLLYDRSHKRPSVYIYLNRKRFHTKGHLDVLEPGSKFILKLNLLRVHPYQKRLKPYHQISPYHKKIGYKLYDYILTRIKEEDLTIKEQLQSQPLSISSLFYIF